MTSVCPSTKCVSCPSTKFISKINSDNFNSHISIRIPSRYQKSTHETRITPVALSKLITHTTYKSKLRIRIISVALPKLTTHTIYTLRARITPSSCQRTRSQQIRNAVGNWRSDEVLLVSVSVSRSLSKRASCYP